MTGPVRWDDPVAAGDFLVRCALEEDAASLDAATCALGPAGRSTQTACAVPRGEIVVCGWFLVEATWRILAEDLGFGAVRVERRMPDGATARPGSVVGTVSGPVDSLLRGERVALNMLARLSGIATLTRRFVLAVEGTGVEILDTRKTTPGHRALERYAVRTGGGTNHRFDLAAMAMIKDNHLAAAGGTDALRPMLDRLPAGLPVEIEVDTLEQLSRVLPLRPARVLLDNMSPDLLRRAVAMAAGSGCYLEASGGVSLDGLRAMAGTGVDGISSGALTHSAAWADIGLDWRSDEQTRS